MFIVYSEKNTKSRNGNMDDSSTQNPGMEIQTTHHQFDFVMHHRPRKTMGKSDALCQRSDHSSGAKDNDNMVLLTPDFFAIQANIPYYSNPHCIVPTSFPTSFCTLQLVRNLL